VFHLWIWSTLRCVCVCESFYSVWNIWNPITSVFRDFMGAFISKRIFLGNLWTWKEFAGSSGSLESCDSRSSHCPFERKLFNHGKRRISLCCREVPSEHSKCSGHWLSFLSGFRILFLLWGTCCPFFVQILELFLSSLHKSSGYTHACILPSLLMSTFPNVWVGKLTCH
jgi:hypothetical protein